jgi:thymidylate kinase
MGSDLNNNTVFLEFYGLPGSGKSTISHLVAEELRKQGKKVIEPTYDTDHRYSSSVRKGIKLLKLIRYEMINPRKSKMLCGLIKANGYFGSSVFSQAANIVPKLWEYDHARADYAIFDEGLTQSAISLVINEGSSSENERVLYNLCKKRLVRKFYIRVSQEKALSRMAGREEHDSRIERIRDEAERKQAIKAFEMQCNGISDCIVVDQKKIEEILGFIMKQLG